MVNVHDLDRPPTVPVLEHGKRNETFKAQHSVSVSCLFFYDLEYETQKKSLPLPIFLFTDNDEIVATGIM